MPPSVEQSTELSRRQERASEAIPDLASLRESEPSETLPAAVRELPPPLEPTIEAVRRGPAEGPSAPVPVMLPRAIYPFGWSRRDVRRGAVFCLTACIGLVFLYYVQAILPPFLIAFSLAALLDPTLRYNESRGRPRVYTILLLYLLALCVLVIVAVWVIPGVALQIEDVTGKLSGYYSSIQDSANLFMHRNARLLNMVGVKEEKVGDLLNAKMGPLQAGIGAALGSVSGITEALLAKALWLVIIPISSFFFMRDFPTIRARIIMLFPAHHQARIDQLSHEIVDVFTAYLRGLAKICTLYACAAGLLFTVLNVRYALLLGILAGLFYAVPYVGNLLTATTAATIAYLMESHAALFWSVPAHSLTYALLVAVSCIVLANIVFDQLVYPRVVGGSVGLHPVVSIFALMAGATLFGIWGMLLATPVAASIQIVLLCLFPKLAQKPPTPLME